MLECVRNGMIRSTHTCPHFSRSNFSEKSTTREVLQLTLRAPYRLFGILNVAIRKSPNQPEAYFSCFSFSSACQACRRQVVQKEGRSSSGSNSSSSNTGNTSARTCWRRPDLRSAGSAPPQHVTPFSRRIGWNFCRIFSQEEHSPPRAQQHPL